MIYRMLRRREGRRRRKRNTRQNGFG